MVKSSNESTNWMVKSGVPVVTNRHSPHSDCLMDEVSTYKSGFPFVTRTLKSAKLFFTITVPNRGISRHLQSLVTEVSDMVKAIRNIKRIDFIALN